MKWRYWFLFFFALSVPVLGSQPGWYRVGPVAGTIKQIEPDRAHPGVWYLLQADDTRLYRSTDNGETWKKTRMDNVRRILVHPASSELFVMRTGRDYQSSSLFVSNDFGDTFQLRCAKAPRVIFAHPFDPKTLWGSGVSNPYDLSVSTDRGAHWQNITNLPYRIGKVYDINGDQVAADDYYLNSVLVSPIDGNTIYVSTEVEFPIACGGDYIDIELFSTNGGKSWTYSEAPDPHYIYDPAFPNRAFSVDTVETRVLTPHGWTRLSYKRLEDIVSVPGKPNKLYAVIGDKQWVSNDGGTTWSYHPLGPAGKARLLKARTSPEDSVIAGTYGAGVYVVNSNGSYRQSANYFDEASISDVATAPNSPVIFAVTGSYYADSFLYRTENYGKTWLNITDRIPGPHRFFQVVSSPNSARHSFVIQTNKIIVTFDGGDTWSTVPQPFLNQVFFDPNSSNEYFSKPNEPHLYRSTDGGLTLQQLPATFGANHNTIHSMAVDPFNGWFYVATQFGLFVSKDNGFTAEQIGRDVIQDCMTCVTFDWIVALPQRGEYITQVREHLYKSTNGGVSWQLLSHKCGTALYIGDDTGKTLFLTNYGKLLQSTDGGQNWVFANFPGKYEVEVLTDPRIRPIYVATSGGMFRHD